MPNQRQVRDIMCVPFVPGWNLEIIKQDWALCINSKASLQDACDQLLEQWQYPVKRNELKLILYFIEKCVQNNFWDSLFLTLCRDRVSIKIRKMQLNKSLKKLLGFVRRISYFNDQRVKWQLPFIVWSFRKFTLPEFRNLCNICPASH